VLRFSLIAVACVLLTGCPSSKQLPPAKDNEAACLAPEAYAALHAKMAPRIFVRPLNAHETAFLSDRVRRDYLLLRMRHRHADLTLDDHIQLDIEVDGVLLDKVPKQIDALAAATGEPPESTTQEAARDLIIWSTGGIALLSEDVTKSPSHVQLFALLGTVDCRRQRVAGICTVSGKMFRLPADQTAPATLVIRHDYLVEYPDGLRERACPPTNTVRIPLPPGETLAERIIAVYPGRRGKRGPRAQRQP
jgi:hypothetical protein